MEDFKDWNTGKKGHKDRKRHKSRIKKKKKKKRGVGKLS